MAEFVDERIKAAGRREAAAQAIKMMNARKKTAKKATSRTVVTPGTKVSQATIDKIKSMGMTAALKGASGASAEMKEGIRRLYGAKRLDAATKSKSSVPAQKSTPERTGFKRVSPYPYSGVKVKSSTRPSGAPGAISGASRNNAPGAVSGKKPVTKTSAARPTASQIKAGESRAGGAYKYKPSKPPIKQVKTAAQKAKEEAATRARRKAAADAVKRAGGRTA